MTVHPPLAVIPDWGPSLTFISKPGGYKYVTDQYAALQASTWNKWQEEEMERNKEDKKEEMERQRQSNDSWVMRGNYKNHKQYSEYEDGGMADYTYPRLGRQRYPKSRTQFLPMRTGPYRGQYSVIGKRTGVGRRTGIGRKGVRKINLVTKQSPELGGSFPLWDSGVPTKEPQIIDLYNPQPALSWQQQPAYQPYQQLG